MWQIEGSPHHPVLQAFSNVPFPVGYLGWLLMFHAGMPGWWGGRAVWTVKRPSEAAILPAGPRFPQRVGDDEAPSELGHRVEVLPGRWRNIQVSRTHTHTDSSLFLLLFTHLIKSLFCLNISKTCLNFTNDSHFRLRKKIFDCRLWPLEIMRQKAGDAKLVRWFCTEFFPFSQSGVHRVITVCVSKVCVCSSVFVCAATWGKPGDPLSRFGARGRGAAVVSWRQPHPRSVQHPTVHWSWNDEKGHNRANIMLSSCFITW